MRDEGDELAEGDERAAFSRKTCDIIGIRDPLIYTSTCG